MKSLPEPMHANDLMPDGVPDEQAAEALQRPSPSVWATFEPQVRTLGPAAAQAAGRALIDSWAMPTVSDPTVLDQVALQIATAAAAVAADPAVDGRDRAAAVADGRAVFDGLAAAHERAEVRRIENNKFLLGTLLVTVAGVIAAWLGRRRR